VHHNSYTLFVGKSTITRKDTSQQLGKNVYPYERSLPRETSPEQFVVDMAEKSERFQWLGEFTGLLKGIAGTGYMARFVELYNDLHGCPKRFLRRLRKKKGEDSEFLIEDAYLSINSTVTPEMLKQFLTEEMVEGGFLARWFLIYGEPHPRPRGRLHVDVVRINENLRNILNAIISMEKDETYFVYGDDALARYQVIEEDAYRKYEKVLPFVGRYLNYLVSFSDILLVSDAIGVSLEKGSSIHSYKQLKQLIQLKSFIQLDNLHKTVKEKYSGESCLNLYSTINRSKSINYLIVSKQYVDRAWTMIEPCLKFASSIVDYVELDKPVAKLMEYLKKVKKATHSKAMQYTHLNSKKMELAIQTLAQMGRIKIENEGIRRKGHGVITKSTYVWIGDEK